MNVYVVVKLDTATDINVDVVAVKKTMRDAIYAIYKQIDEKYTEIQIENSLDIIGRFIVDDTVYYIRKCNVD